MTIKKEYNTILVIVDRLTKYFYIILFKKKYTAEQLGTIMLNKLIWYNEIIKEITSNRNMLFTSNY